MKKYGIIYIDPPWRFRVWNRDTGSGRSADSHYPTMTLEQIMSLELPMAENCAVFMWATLPMLPEALETIKVWGKTEQLQGRRPLEYKTVAFVWVKMTKGWRGWFDRARREMADVTARTIVDHLFHFGMGYWSRANVEVCLLATRGKIARVRKDVRQLVIAPVGAHSEKPDEVADRIVRLMGPLPRLEMFARKPREGWDVFGNEVESDVSIEVPA